MRLLIYIFGSTVNGQKGWVGYTETPDGKVLSPLFDNIDSTRYYFIGKLSARCKRVWGYSGFEFIFEDPKPDAPFEVPDETPFREKQFIIRRGKMKSQRVYNPLSRQVELPNVEDVREPIVDAVPLPFITETKPKSDNEQGEYLYKREGNKLIIYKKVLVEKYKLSE